jgi:tRNA G26 N,N-dimethylase Trm1
MLTLDEALETGHLLTFVLGLLQKGYAVSRSHITSNAIKTNCPMTECIKIAKELQQISVS